jgi:hypothetical protein
MPDTPTPSDNTAVDPPLRVEAASSNGAAAVELRRPTPPFGDDKKEERENSSSGDGVLQCCGRVYGGNGKRTATLERQAFKNGSLKTITYSSQYQLFSC